MNTKTAALFKEWQALCGLSLAEAQVRFSVSDEQLELYLGYGELENLTGLANRAKHPGFFYFRDGAFALFYISKMDDDIETLYLQALLDYLGEPEAIHPSNIGKRQQQYVYAEKGVSFSATDDEVTFIEFFEPLCLSEYNALFYEEPEPFER